MFIGDISNRLQLYYDLILNYQICKIFAETESIVIIYFQWLLSLNTKSFLLKAMHQTVFINLLQQARTKVSMQIVGNLPNPRYQRFEVCLFIFFQFYLFSISTLLHG